MQHSLVTNQYMYIKFCKNWININKLFVDEQIDRHMTTQKSDFIKLSQSRSRCKNAKVPA